MNRVLPSHYLMQAPTVFSRQYMEGLVLLLTLRPNEVVVVITILRVVYISIM
jgi:hypothetical protein